jgi:hypothetical protein
MSVANYSPTFREQVVDNSLVAYIPIPIKAAGAALHSIPLLQTAGGVEKTLTLGAGVWAIHSEAFIGFTNDAQVVEFGQVLIQTAGGDTLASSAAFIGADLGAGAGANVLVVMACDSVLSLAVATTLRLRYSGNGNDFALAVSGAGGNNTFIRAIKLN